MALRIIPVAFANFLLHKFAKSLPFFSAPCELLKKNLFPPRLKQYHALSPFQGLKYFFSPYLAIKLQLKSLLWQYCNENVSRPKLHKLVTRWRDVRNDFIFYPRIKQSLKILDEFLTTFLTIYIYDD